MCALWSKGELCLHQIASLSYWQRRTAGSGPAQRSEQGTGQTLGRADASKLRRRLWSEGSAISRSHAHSGERRRATAPHGIGTWSSDMTLSELARKSLTGDCEGFPPAFRLTLGISHTVHPILLPQTSTLPAS